MISVDNVSKTFDYSVPKTSFVALIFPKMEKLTAVHRVSLKVQTGEIYGLLGPNGAGKTTLIKMICGLLKPTSGKISIGGKEVYSAQRDIGIMLGSSMIYTLMTGRDNLEYVASLFGIENPRERITELADLLQIGNWIDRYVSEYSLGMRTKLCLARALIHNPSILLLDEPTLGLDPAFALYIRNQIKKIGKTIILTTHYMEEADFLSDRVGIVHHGRLIAEGTPSELKEKIQKRETPSLTDVFIELTTE